jgi:hypothetical protein
MIRLINLAHASDLMGQIAFYRHGHVRHDKFGPEVIPI